MNLELEFSAAEYSIYQFAKNGNRELGNLIAEAGAPGFFSVTSTPDEVSVVARTGFFQESSLTPHESSDGWRYFRVVGPLEFSQTGILSEISQAMASAKIPILAIATFDTDYVFFPNSSMEATKKCLENSGFRIKL